MEAIKPSDEKIQWNERPIVWVDGTVMERREDGWIPHLGNGHSKVAIYESAFGTHYKLYAYRSQDKVVTLDSLIPVGMPFFRGNEIFQHWQIGEKRLGLAFNGTADARSFDRGIRVALENLEKARQQQQNASSSVSSHSSGQVSDDGVSDSPNSSTAPPDNRRWRANKYSTSSTASSSCMAASPKRVNPATVSSSCGDTTARLPSRTSAVISPASSHQRDEDSPTTTPVEAQRLGHKQQAAAPHEQERRRHSSVPGHVCRVTTSSVVNGVRSTAHDAAATTATMMPRRSPPLPSSSVVLSTTAVPDDLTIGTAILTTVKDIRSQDTGASTLSTTVSMTNEVTSKSHHQHHHRSSNHNGGRRHQRGSNGGGSGRIRLNKPPTLSKLDQKRDMQPTKYNSYVQINDSTKSALSSGGTSGSNVRSMASSQVLHHSTSYGRPRSISPTVVPLQPYATVNQPSVPNDYRFYLGGKSVDPASDPMLVNSAGPFKQNSQRGSKGSKKDLGERLKCRHCQSYYNQDRNQPGSCRDAPADNWQRCFRYISCLICANAMLYHGCRDEEGNYPRASCSCTDRRDNGYSLPRRWLTLLLLSFMIPCLCLYPALAGCHRCAVACRCCGGRHEPPVQSPHSDGKGSSGRQLR